MFFKSSTVISSSLVSVVFEEMHSSLCLLFVCLVKPDLLFYKSSCIANSCIDQVKPVIENILIFMHLFITPNTYMSNFLVVDFLGTVWTQGLYKAPFLRLI